uniref:G-protein coupled receptors family 1 profile domain-containing protein n=1 Tax=Parascaris univalens TaxID=6257 RepID=A0A915AX93_PARUN
MSSNLIDERNGLSMDNVIVLFQIGLSFIALHFALDQIPNASYEQMFYSTYFEDIIINTFLVASFYCALMLTIARYVLITQPHTRRSTNPKRMARIRIILLEPIFTLFNYYKMSREFLRFTCVIAMAVLNIFIARKLQITKNRRRMILRPKTNLLSVKLPSNDATCLEFYATDTAKRENCSLMRSFTEKKLTALMIAITFIFMIGNLPQTVVMVLQNDSHEYNFSFQLLRNVANALEVLNHCLNFYVFCLASSEYTRAFLLNCLCVRRVLTYIPACTHFIYSRKSSSCAASRQNSMRFKAVNVCNDDLNGDPVERNSGKQWSDGDHKARCMWQFGSSSCHATTTVFTNEAASDEYHRNSADYL